MILSEKVVEQSVDRVDKGRFVKQLVLVDGAVPLAMVRKRAASRLGDPGGTRAPVLLIHGYGQNRYAWHLPLRSVSNFLARLGYDVFNLDLRGHGRSAHLGARRPVGPDDYVREDVPTAIEEIQHLTGGQKVFLVGHSLGGLVSYAVAPRAPDAVAGVASIGSPYHFCRGARSLAAIGGLLAFVESRAQLLEGDLAMELRLVGELVRSFRAFVDSPLYPLPVRGYSPDNIERDVLSQHMALAMDMGSIRVMRLMFRWARERESRIDVPGGVEGFGEAFEQMTGLPLLVVAGSKDDLAPPPGVKSAFDRSLAEDKTYRCVPAGHIDLLVGRGAPRTTWPILEAWLGRRAPALRESLGPHPPSLQREPQLKGPGGHGRKPVSKPAPPTPSSPRRRFRDGFTPMGPEGEVAVAAPPPRQWRRQGLGHLHQEIPRSSSSARASQSPSGESAARRRRPPARGPARCRRGARGPGKRPRFDGDTPWNPPS